MLKKRLNNSTSKIAIGLGLLALGVKCLLTGIPILIMGSVCSFVIGGVFIGSSINYDMNGYLKKDKISKLEKSQIN